MTARMLWCMAVLTRVLGAQGVTVAPLLRSEPAVASGEAVVLGLTTLTAMAVIPLDHRIAAGIGTVTGLLLVRHLDHQP